MHEFNVGLKMIDSKVNIVVLGAGLSGLGFSHTLPGARIFEANAYPGGHTYSHELHNYYFDQGAHISHTKSLQFSEMIYKCAGDVHHIHGCNVSNYWHGRWMRYPIQNHLCELPLDERSLALTDLVMVHINQISDGADNYSDWCQNQYGEYLTKHFYQEYTQKYWRLPMRELATDWLDGRLIPAAIPNIIRGAFTAQIEKEASFAQFRYPVNSGFFNFFKSLYDDIDIQFNERAIEIDVNRKEIIFESGRKEHYTILASSIPLPQFIAIAKDVPPAVKEAADLLRYTKLLCVNMIVDRPNISSFHWCYVYDEDILPARISFPMNLSQRIVSHGVSTLQAEIFRSNDEKWDVESLVETTVKQMANLFNFNVKNELKSATPLVIPFAYIISDHNRKKSVEYIISWLEQKDIYCMGLYGKWKYIWSDLAYASGIEVANKIMEKVFK